jgi:hypothetical protein
MVLSWMPECGLNFTLPDAIPVIAVLLILQWACPPRKTVLLCLCLREAVVACATSVSAMAAVAIIPVHSGAGIQVIEIQPEGPCRRR